MVGAQHSFIKGEIVFGYSIHLDQRTIHPNLAVALSNLPEISSPVVHIEPRFSLLSINCKITFPLQVSVATTL